MRQFIIVVIYIFFQQICYSQSSEGYANLPEGIIKNEVASFLISAHRINQTDNISNTLVEIKLKRCSEDFVYFESGDIISLDKLVSIQSKAVNVIDNKITGGYTWGIGNSPPTTEVSKVRYIHVKFQLILPDTAIAGLFNPKFCINPKKKNKIGKTTTSNCKVYQSQDKRRVYIYMLNGEESAEYEVTWVIENGRYYRRIVDNILSEKREDRS